LNKPNKSTVYWYLIRSFLTIGSVSFGGYLPLVAMIKTRLVERDKMLDEERITEALALGSLLPGPLAVNVTAYVSFLLGGVTGSLLAVIAVLLPSFLLLLLFSVLYFEFHIGASFDYILMGILPVILAIIISMSVKMYQSSCKTFLHTVIALTSLVLLLFLPGYWTIFFIIVGSGVLGVFLYRDREHVKHSFVRHDMWFLLVPALVVIGYLLFHRFVSANQNLLLFDVFAKTSLTLFGGGYVMIPILELLLVNQLHWVSSNEFLVGISLGHITPGPILISAAFFGYKVNGAIGSLVAVLGIFLPSAGLMIICSRFYSQISGNPVIKAALKAIRPAIVGMIGYSAVSLALGDKLFGGIQYLAFFAIGAFVLLEVLKVGPVKAVLLGLIAGSLIYLIRS
jgi:chromate transporter